MLIDSKTSYFFYPSCFALMRRKSGERGGLGEIDCYDDQLIRKVIYLTRHHCIYFVGRIYVTDVLWLLSVSFIMLVRYFLNKGFIYPNIGILFTIECENNSEILWNYDEEEGCVESNLILPYERVIYYGAKGHRALIRFFYYMTFKVFMRSIFRHIGFYYKFNSFFTEQSVKDIIGRYNRLKAYHAKHKDRLWEV